MNQLQLELMFQFLLGRLKTKKDTRSCFLLRHRPIACKSIEQRGGATGRKDEHSSYA